MSKLYVGVDWHKRTSTWVAINEAREQIYSRSWNCTPEDVQTAIASLPAKPEEMKLAIEPVCGWRWMSALCEEVGIDVRIANTLKLRQIAESKQKTDKNDAITLAELLRADYLPEAYRAPEDIQQLRMLVRERSFFINKNTAAKCRIHSICTALGSHTTAARPLHKEGYDTLHTKDSLFVDMYDSLLETNQHIKNVEERIRLATITNRTYEILCSIPGVGMVTASAICAEVGDFARFESPKQLISYAGLYPKERSSGEQKHYGGMSKIGSKVLRYAIIEAALKIRDVEKTKNLYTHYLAAKEDRHKTPKQARVVLAHKLLTIAWHFVRNDTPYNDALVRPAQREMTS